MDIKKSERKKTNYDLILDLPTDKNQPTHTELKVIDSLFGKTKENFNNVNKTTNIYNQVIKYAILIFLFMLVSNIPDQKLPTLPFLSNYEFSPMLMKGIILAGVFYLVDTKILTCL